MKNWVWWHTIYNPSTWETEPGGKSSGQLGLHRELQTSLGCKTRSCPKKPKKLKGIVCKVTYVTYKVTKIPVCVCVEHLKEGI
jgi:hypothetical protein